MRGCGLLSSTLVCGSYCVPSPPTGVTFSTSGGSPTTHKVHVEYSCSREVKRPTSEYTGVSFEVNGATATLPTNVPAICFCVNYYVETIFGPGAGSFIWAGTLSIERLLPGEHHSA